jgi:hypothetical protein
VLGKWTLKNVFDNCGLSEYFLNMTTLAKLIASVAALIASLALAWIAKEGVTVYSGIVDVRFQPAANPPELIIRHKSAGEL